MSRLKKAMEDLGLQFLDLDRSVESGSIGNKVVRQ